MIFLLAFVISSVTEEIYFLERYKQEAITRRALLKQISNKFINLIKVFWKRKRLLNKVCKD